MKQNNLLLLAGAGAALLLLKHKKKETTNAPIYDNPEDANRDYYAEWLAEKENGNTDLEYEVWLRQIFPTGAYGIGALASPKIKRIWRLADELRVLKSQHSNHLLHHYVIKEQSDGILLTDKRNGESIKIYY